MVRPILKDEVEIGGGAVEVPRGRKHQEKFWPGGEYLVSLFTVLQLQYLLHLYQPVPYLTLPYFSNSLALIIGEFILLGKL